jgi:hypothetical protein
MEGTRDFGATPKLTTKAPTQPATSGGSAKTTTQPITVTKPKTTFLNKLKKQTGKPTDE